MLRNGGNLVRRPREELVFHFPHYDLENDGPASALYLGDWKLYKAYETGAARLFDLEGSRRTKRPSRPNARKNRGALGAARRLSESRPGADARAESELRSGTRRPKRIAGAAAATDGGN